jgi:hypothetical protein
MTDPIPPVSGRIFLSYRREDTRHVVGRIGDRLTDHFGDERVFVDVDTIEPGLDFAEAIAAAVGSCHVLLALIGDQWLDSTDRKGRRKLDDANDLVRLEIQAALERNIRVIPVLVDGVAMPTAEELPPSLVGLARRQAFELSYSRFRDDARRLIDLLDRLLSAPKRQPPPHHSREEHRAAAGQLQGHPRRHAADPAVHHRGDSGGSCRRRGMGGPGPAAGPCPLVQRSP